MRILLTGGGTGGHITPLIAVAQELKKFSREKNLPNPELLFLGPDSFSKELLAKENIKMKTILAGKLRRYFSLLNFLDIFKFPVGLIQALWHVFVFMPDIVFAKGGFGSVPVVMASRLFRIPVLLHESDIIPGLANRFLSRFAKKIAVSFSSALNYFPSAKTALIGSPIRNDIIGGSAEQARQIYGLTGGKPIIFIFNGSQGAQPINEKILQILPQLLQKYELIWQTGTSNFNQVAKETKQANGSILSNCHLAGFMDENQIAAAFAAASLVIARAGSSTIFEIAACGKPSVLIPLPTSASGHQRENAFEYAKTGAAVVIEQTNLTPNLFLNEISQLINNPELLAKMSACAKSFAKPDASRQIAEEILKLATSH